MKTYHQQQQRTSRTLETSQHPNKRYPIQLMRIIQMEKGEEIPLLIGEIDSSQKTQVTSELASQIKEAHDVESNDFVHKQQSYMNYLCNNLRLPIEKIMSFHKSAGYEFEFASFKIIGQICDKNKEYMQSHERLANSEVLNASLFNLPFALETDSNNSIELVSPPFIFLRSYLPEGVLSGTFSKYTQKLNEVNEELAGKEVEIPTFQSSYLSMNDFGDNWTSMPNLQNFRIISNQKHTNGTYGQANVSMTTEEITKVLAAQNTDKILNKQNPRDPRSILTQFEDIQQILDIGHQNPLLKDALLLYSRLIINLLGIPSILFRQKTTKRSDTNYATEIKEILGVWIKAYPHEIILDYIEKQQIKQPFLDYIARKQSEVCDYLQQQLDQIVAYLKPEVPVSDTLLLAKRQQMVNPDPSTSAVTSGIETKKADEENKCLNEYKTIIYTEFQKFMEHLKNNTKPSALPEANFTAEKFESGFGVRKGTFLTPIETSTKEKLYITELRNQYALEAYERIYSRTTPPAPKPGDFPTFNFGTSHRNDSGSDESSD